MSKLKKHTAFICFLAFVAGFSLTLVTSPQIGCTEPSANYAVLNNNLSLKELSLEYSEPPPMEIYTKIHKNTLVPSYSNYADIYSSRAEPPPVPTQNMASFFSTDGQAENIIASNPESDPVLTIEEAAEMCAEIYIFRTANYGSNILISSSSNINWQIIDFKNSVIKDLYEAEDIENRVAAEDFADKKAVRQEMFYIIYSTLVKTSENIDPTNLDNTELNFLDNTELSEWCIIPVKFLYKKGYIFGNNNSMLKPKDPALKSEFDSILKHIEALDAHSLKHSGTGMFNKLKKILYVINDETIKRAGLITLVQIIGAISSKLKKYINSKKGK